jgi:hypothetical protein
MEQPSAIQGHGPGLPPNSLPAVSEWGGVPLPNGRWLEEGLSGVGFLRKLGDA